MRKLALLRPFLWLLGVTAVVIAVGHLANPQYDDGGFGLLWFVVAMPVSIPYQVVASPLLALLGGGKSTSVVTPTTYASLLSLADHHLTRWARKRASPPCAA